MKKKYAIASFPLFHFTGNCLFLLLLLEILSLKSNANSFFGNNSTSISIVSKPTALADEQVISFTLINADTDQPIQQLTAESVLNLVTLPTKNLNIQANVSPGSAGSVKFTLSGQQSLTQIENTLPYALFGGEKEDYNGWVPELGTYTLMATPYSAKDATGNAGVALTVSFLVISNQLPKANAGPDKTLILPAKSIVLNGSGTDADGTITAYSWNQISGPKAATFSSKTVAEPSLNNLTEGNYLFSLQVKDNQNTWSAADTTAVSVLKSTPPVISGELKKWHKVTLTFTGPLTSEIDGVNPFLNYRLNVVFSKGSRKIVVPGYYAADGKAAETSAADGSKWRVHFSPHETGKWSYRVSFRTGKDVAISNLANAGSVGVLDGVTGSFTIAPSDKAGLDLRAQGRLRYVGQHHLQFAETGKYFLKGGADSPENFLAYKEFDGTYSQNPTVDYTKTYGYHLADWQPGDPTWKEGKGKGIIGALNYLAGKGMNSVYFLTLNVNGDGKDVWPWISPNEENRYDVSKLDQWEIVFTHMDKLGLMLHVITQEQENDQLLDNGNLGIQRKLYYRELIARFGHHLAITWNLGEENTNTNAQRKAFCNYIRSLDPYNSPIDVHSHPDQRKTVYTPLLGYANLEGPSLQIVNSADTHSETLHWLKQSAASGRKWVVNLDEIGPSFSGVKPDADDYTHDAIRKQALWGNLMAGGGGVEWYFGYKYPNSDLTAQDWRSRDHMWDLTHYALQFFNQYLPFWQMQSADNLTAATNDFCLALSEKVYVVYLPQGGSTTLKLGNSTGTYLVQWYNPRTGGTLQNGTIRQITGPGIKSLGLPPKNDKQDWVCLITNLNNTLTKTTISDLSSWNPIATNDQTEASFWVFPNPIQNQVTINANLPAALPLEITLRDVNGKRVAYTSAAAAQIQREQLNTNHLKPGIYLLQIKYGNQITTRKLVKQ